MTVAKKDKGVSQARPYAYATGSTRAQRTHRMPASEIRKRFIAVGWVGQLTTTGVRHAPEI